jgi:hypothetical protein
MLLFPGTEDPVFTFVGLLPGEIPVWRFRENRRKFFTLAGAIWILRGNRKHENHFRPGCRIPGFLFCAAVLAKKLCRACAGYHGSPGVFDGSAGRETTSIASVSSNGFE